MKKPANLQKKDLKKKFLKKQNTFLICLLFYLVYLFIYFLFYFINYHHPRLLYYLYFVIIQDG